DLHNVAVILSGDSAVIHLGEDQFLQRLESYLDLASALRERVADIDYVDLRFDDRIYVRPVGQKRRTVRKWGPERCVQVEVPGWREGNDTWSASTSARRRSRRSSARCSTAADSTSSASASRSRAASGAAWSSTSRRRSTRSRRRSKKPS